MTTDVIRDLDPVVDQLVDTGVGPGGAKGDPGSAAPTDHQLLTNRATADAHAQYPLATGGAVNGLTSTGGTETVTAVASGATMTLDMNAGPAHVMSPQDENTTLALSNAATGKSASADLLQGVGGGFAINVPGAWKPYITPSPTVVAGEWNHVEVWQVGSVVFYTLKGQT